MSGTQLAVYIVVGLVIFSAIFIVLYLVWTFFSESNLGKEFIKRNAYLVAPFFVKVRNIQMLKGKSTTNKDIYCIRKGWLYYRYHGYTSNFGWTKAKFMFSNFEEACEIWDESVLKHVQEKDTKNELKRVYLERVK